MGAASLAPHEAGPFSLLEGIAETCPDAIMCADENGRIIFWNGAAERMFGHSAAVATTSRQDLILPADARPDYEDWLLKVRNREPGTRFADHIELMAVRADGSIFPAEITYSSWYARDGFVICSMIRDVTARHEADRRLRDLACRDQLTGLPNRAAFLDQLGAAIGTDDAGKEREVRCALLLVGLDRFKEINDWLGHESGDRLLQRIANRLARFQSQTVFVARLSGDEFTLIQTGGDIVSAASLARSVRRALRRPIRSLGRHHEIGASIGIALFPEHAAMATDLLANADLAIHRAKVDGGNHTRVYLSTLREAAQSRRQTEGELRYAFREGHLELFFQPQVSLSDETIVGAEALLRWRHPKHGLLSPASFLPVLETSTLSSTVGNWAIDWVVAEASRLIAKGGRPLRFGVNLFASQLIDGDLAGFVLAALDRHGLPPACLEIEITENIALRHESGVTAPLKRLIEAGVGIAFDDFGTGYGSLSYLKRVPVTRLKIDKSFIRGVIADAGDAAIIRAVLTLGRSLGLGVIAEGIETQQQRLALRKFGCAEGQGFLFGKPMIAAEFGALIGTERSGSADVVGRRGQRASR